MVQDNNRQFTASALAVSFSFVSLLASLLTLLLIRRLRKWNGYMQLVVSLTVCQVIYDISFFFLPVRALWGEYIYLGLNTFGGLSTSLWSNVIILVTARIVIRLRTVDTLKKYPQYLAVVAVPSTIIAVASVVFYSRGDEYDYVIMCYFALRSASIVLNLVAIAVIFFKISLMHGPSSSTTPAKESSAQESTAYSSSHSHSQVLSAAIGRNQSHERVHISQDGGESSTVNSMRSTEPDSTTSEHRGGGSFASSDNSVAPSPTTPPKSNPVFLLSKRLVYYCMVQSITRIGSSWYQLAYGFGDDSDYDASEASTLKTVVYLSEFVLNPSAGIGYLVVFLLIQPEAWRELRSMLGCPAKSPGRGKKQRKKQTRKYTHDSDVPSGHHPSSSTVLDSSSLHSRSDGYLREQGRYHYDSDSDDVPEEEFDSLRDTNNTLSSNDSSLFPLLEDMTEDDLAREIERQYNPDYHSISIASDSDQKAPLIGGGASFGRAGRW